MNIILFTEAEAFRPLERRDPRAAHLLKVLHKQCGDEFNAGIIGARRGQGIITRIDKDAVFFSLSLNEAPPARLPVEAAIGFPRPIQLRRILRELSNMGVAAISLFGSDRGEKSYRDTALLRDGGAQAALLEGAVQARDTMLPKLAVFPSAEQWLASGLPSGYLRIVADNARPSGSFAGLPDGQSGFVLAIGSERGWSDRERGLFGEAAFQSRSLGERALRTETALVAAVALAAVKLRASPAF